MTILFYLKPNNYSFPPSGVPIWKDYDALRKKHLKAARKLYLEGLKLKKKRKEEEDLLLLLLGLSED